jgi:hypothetical protein
MVYIFSMFVSVEQTLLFPIASLLTAIAFIIIGVLKSYVNGMSKIK